MTNLDKRRSSAYLSYIIFLPTIAVIILNIITVIFPALIIRLASAHPSNINAYEIGSLAFPLIAANTVLLGIGLMYYKKILPNPVQKSIKFILNFEISRTASFIVIAALLSLYVGFSVNELFINEEEQWPDYVILKNALKIWPHQDSTDIYVSEQLQRHVRMFLLYTSLNVFHNIKFLPFIASISLVILTYSLTAKLAKKRFAGIIAAIILLQSYTFLKYDTVAVYENFWVLFYILSLYMIYTKWYLSPIAYLLSVFSKAFSAPFLFMTAFMIYRSNITRNKKIQTLFLYGIIVVISVVIFILTRSVYVGLLDIDLSRFWVGLNAWGSQMRFDPLIVLCILPLAVGLFLKSIRGVREADSMMVLILGAFLAGPILTIFTNFYTIHPYRHVPLVVFFAMGVGVLLARKTNVVQGG